MATPSVNPNGLLAGKVAIVTGASRGIGAAIALRYAMEGAKVVVTARTVEPADHPLPGTITDTVDRIRKAGGAALAVKADIGHEADRVHLVKAAQEAFGPVDILVNNAAVTWFIPVDATASLAEVVHVQAAVQGWVWLAARPSCLLRARPK